MRGLDRSVMKVMGPERGPGPFTAHLGFKGVQVDALNEIEGHRRVLVVEDDESAAVFVTRVLERAGFESSWAIDADEASTMLAGANFDVLLTDFRLPGRSGLELVKETRSARPEIGIAMMTSYNESDLERTARSSGADDFFEKPLTASTLVSRITTLAQRVQVPELRSSLSPLARGAHVVPAAATPGVQRGGTSGSSPQRPTTTGCEEAGDGGSLGSGSGGDAGPTAQAHESAPRELSDAQASNRPIFRRIGPATRAIASVPLWASAAPVVSHVMSGTGPVTTPRTSAAWSFVN